MTERKDQDQRLAATRLAAIQAVYEQDMVDADVDDILAAFSSGRWTAADADVDAELAKLRPGLFETLLRGVSLHRDEIDSVIDAALVKDRPSEELEKLLLAIIRVATFELMQRRNVPARAALSAYTGLADAFFDDEGPQLRLLAGLLNGIARVVRPDEFDAAGAERTAVE